MCDERGHRIGYGMATALYPVRHAAAAARVVIDHEGEVSVQCATQEMGCGTGTALAQIAADALGVDVARVTVEIGDARLPETSAAESSHTLSSIGSAVLNAAAALRLKLLQTAVVQPGGPLNGADVCLLRVRAGRAYLLGRHPSTGVALQDVVVAAGQRTLDAAGSTDDSGSSMRACGAHFVEVRIDPCLPNPRVRRIVSAFAVGRPVNPLLVESQLKGGIVQGIGMALFEATTADRIAGGFLNTSLGGYLVPTCADVPAITVRLVADADFSANRLGAKGVGELGIVGVAGAIANAVCHATGVRLRRLPIRLDDLLHMPAWRPPCRS
jgi:xanthine dehydrogenase YagR molybdenum-binding subunit